MKEKTVRAVCEWWNDNEEDDISTERLLQMCCDTFNLEDHSVAVTALIKGGVFVKAGK